MSEHNLKKIIQTMQAQIEQEVSRIVTSRQNIIDELQEKVEDAHTSSQLLGRNEMKERVLKLLQNEALFAKIDSYIPNFIEKKVYEQIIRALIPQIISLE